MYSREIVDPLCDLAKPLTTLHCLFSDTVWTCFFSFFFFLPKCGKKYPGLLHFASITERDRGKGGEEGEDGKEKRTPATQTKDYKDREERGGGADELTQIRCAHPHYTLARHIHIPSNSLHSTPGPITPSFCNPSAGSHQVTGIDHTPRCSKTVQRFTRTQWLHFLFHLTRAFLLFPTLISHTPQFLKRNLHLQLSVWFFAVFFVFVVNFYFLSTSLV